MSHVKYGFDWFLVAGIDSSDLEYRAALWNRLDLTRLPGPVKE